MVFGNPPQRYRPCDIFNIDETGLFYQCLPNKMFTFHGERVSRTIKESKQQLTLLVGANMDGSKKLDLLVIVKLANPRCFKEIYSLPAQYKANTKAWITSVVWTDWLKAFDHHMKGAGCNVLLVINNYPAHPVVPGLSNVEVVFLPPSTTSPVTKALFRHLSAGTGSLC